MNPKLSWLRLWRDNTDEFRTKGVALLGILLIFIGVTIDYVPLIGAGAAVVAACIGWMIRVTLKANARRRRLTVSLGEALVAQSEADTAINGDFPDIPIWIGREHIYCAGASEVESHLLDQLIWAYAEMYRAPFFRRYQLVLWNRDAVATVLAVHKAFRDAALERIRTAAPWVPVGYSEAMKETWNADNADLLALVDSYRRIGRRFDAAWAGNAVASVVLEP
jgi:hypothetical protein